MGIGSTGDALVTHTIDGVDLNTVWETVVAGFEAHNAHRSSIADLLSFRTTVPGEAIPQGVSSPPMERLTEYGIPNAANVPSNVLMLGYDFGDFGLRSAFTWQALRKMTADQVYAHVNSIMHSDNRLVTGTILKRLLDPQPRTNAEGIQCRGLYSADGQIPPDYLNRSFDGTETHYIKSGATQIDSGDLEDSIRLIRQHGYGRTPDSKILILASEIESEQIQTFRQGEESRPSSNIMSKYSFVPSKSAPSYLTPDNIVGEPVEGTVFGVECLGSLGPALLVQTEFIPQGYVAVVATGGPNSIANVVGVREHPIESYRGLLAVAGVNAYPITDSTYIRSFGVGVRQRGAAVAVQIGTGSTYVPPVIAT
ncbi:hypothetical protein B1790_02930 [Mycobacterium sp. AT1]|nr:hypothetical protein B1790_02930 [Mycobacterium sp. AT1]